MYGMYTTTLRSQSKFGSLFRERWFVDRIGCIILSWVTASSSIIYRFKESKQLHDGTMCLLSALDKLMWKWIGSTCHLSSSIVVGNCLAIRWQFPTTLRVCVLQHILLRTINSEILFADVQPPLTDVKLCSSWLCLFLYSNFDSLVSEDCLCLILKSTGDVRSLFSWLVQSYITWSRTYTLRNMSHIL